MSPQLHEISILFLCPLPAQCFGNYSSVESCSDSGVLLFFPFQYRRRAPPFVQHLKDNIFHVVLPRFLVVFDEKASPGTVTSRTQLQLATGSLYIFPFLVTLAAYGSSQARDQIQATVVIMPQLQQHQILKPLCWAGDRSDACAETSWIVNMLCHGGSTWVCLNLCPSPLTWLHHATGVRLGKAHLFTYCISHTDVVLLALLINSEMHKLKECNMIPENNQAFYKSYH